MCNACRLPITQADMESEHYEQGVSCPKCIDKHTGAQKAAFREREYQVRLARERGEQHVGGEARKVIEQRRAQKKVPTPTSTKGLIDIPIGLVLGENLQRLSAALIGAAFFLSLC